MSSAQSISLNLKQVLRHIPQQMEVASVPGLVMAVIAESQVLSPHTFGVKSITTNEPVSDDTVFQAASLSKPVFAYAVLGMEVDGLIDLDRPLSHYLRIDESRHEPRLQVITARHVLSHTSGLQNWRFEPGDVLHIAFAPGDRFSYSGEGYFYLQRVLEQITGQAIEAYLQEQVFRPFGMRQSSYIWLPAHEQQIAMGHRDLDQSTEPWNSWQGRRMLELATQWNKPLSDWRYDDVVQALPDIHPELTPLPNNIIPNAAGSLLTTAPDYAQFMIRMLDSVSGTTGAFDQRANRVRRAMLTPQVALNSALAWGLGWGLEQVDGQTYFWHWGENGLFATFAIGHLASGSGVVILTNGNKGLKVCEPIVRRITGHDHVAFLWL